MSSLDISISVWIIGVFISIGFIGGFSFSREDRESVYLLWLAPIWPMAIIVVIPAVIAYRMFKTVKP